MIQRDHLVVHLNVIEKITARRGNVSLPLYALTAVSVAEEPWDRLIPDRVRMGFAASTAPGRKTAAVGPEASSGDGKAPVVVCKNRPSVVVDIDETMSRYSLVIVSVRDPAKVAAMIERSIISR